MIQQKALVYVIHQFQQNVKTFENDEVQRLQSLQLGSLQPSKTIPKQRITKNQNDILSPDHFQPRSRRLLESLTVHLSLQMTIQILIYNMGLLFPKVGDESRRIRFGESNEMFFNNKVDTAKYNLITFLPKSVLLQFLRLSNIVFLVNAVLQSLPIISSMSPITAIGPLAFVLGVSMLREGYEDYKRHKKDWQINSRITHVLRKGEFIDIEWDQIKPGDYIKVYSGEIIPADLLLLNSSQQNSICYVETATLDGENNLKEKYALTDPIKLYPHEFEGLRGMCLVNAPCSNLYDFQGEIYVENQQPQDLSYSNLVLRETVLKNTDQIVGVAIYCGYDSKILKNQGQVHHKMSQIEQKVNYIQIVLVIILIAMCISSSIGYSIIHNLYNLRSAKSYIPKVSFNINAESTLIFFTIFLMLNFLIPITLNIVIEGIKTFSGIFLTLDKKLYDQSIKKQCGVLNTSIIEELGVVDCVLTDKTGTLTANEMVFQKIALKNSIIKRDDLENNLEKYRTDPHFDDFWLGLIICHDVVKDQHKDQFQGSSPDEVCFINYAHSIGYSFIKRTKNFIEIHFQEEKQVYEFVEMIPFSSRKRMSVIVRDTCKDNEYIVYTKGADSNIYEKAHPYEYAVKFNENLNSFAKEGLRTLVFSKRIISKQIFERWHQKKIGLKNEYKQKMITKQEYLIKQSQLIDQIESHLTIIGATGIEDKLQEGVPQTISRLQKAGIKVMMITGDKLQTAENIGYLAQLIKEHFLVFRLSTDITDIQEKAYRIVKEIESNQRQISVIIQGRQISKILEESNPQVIANYCKILQRAQSVIFCRSSPKEKALIVKFVKKHLKYVVLGIGDGGNDVGMIQQAQIGVGIIGKEGNSAAVVSDFSFGKFRFLDRLILHHGRWYYYRLSYFFIFFGWKNVIITFIIFFFLTESAFSGSFNFTEPFYVLYNSLFSISILVNFGLFEQDINDDLQPLIWKYLPDIYRDTKKKQLFSYKRYFTWFATALALALFIYYVLRISVAPDAAINADGQVLDLAGFKIINGLPLVIIITMINYIDTKSRSYFFELFVFLIGTIVPTASYYIAQNYLPIMNNYNYYNDYFNLRFWLAIFFIVSVIYMVKVAYQYYEIEDNPSIIDKYLIAKDNDVSDLESVLIKAVEQSQIKSQKVISQNEDVMIQSKASYEMKESDVFYNKKESYSTFQSHSKQFYNSSQAVMQVEQARKRSYKAQIINIQQLSEESS